MITSSIWLPKNNFLSSILQLIHKTYPGGYSIWFCYLKVNLPLFFVSIWGSFGLPQAIPGLAPTQARSPAPPPPPASQAIAHAHVRAHAQIDVPIQKISQTTPETPYYPLSDFFFL